MAASASVDGLAAQGETGRLPVIDMHLHAVPLNGNGPPPVAVCAPFERFPVRDIRVPGGQALGHMTKNPPCENPIWSPESDEALMLETLAVLERENVIGVTSGPITLVDRWKAAAPDRIIPAISAPIGTSRAPTVEQLRTWYDEGRFEVLGEIASQYSNVSMSDPVFDPYLEFAAEFDIPVAVHVGPGPPGIASVGAGYRASLSSALQLEEALLRHPNVRVYAMHAGWPMTDDMIAMLWAHSHLHVDLGVISFAIPEAEFYQHLRRIVEAGFEDRVMFGSDQMQWPEAIAIGIERIRSAPFLTQEQIDKILFHNAVRFLRLDAEALVP